MGWSEKRMETLRSLWLEGKSSTVIAQMLGGVTRNAVMGKANRMGLLGSAEHNSRMTSIPTGCIHPVVAAEPSAEDDATTVPAVESPSEDATVASTADAGTVDLAKHEAAPVDRIEVSEVEVLPEAEAADGEETDGAGDLHALDRLYSRAEPEVEVVERKDDEVISITPGTVARAWRRGGDMPSDVATAMRFVFDLTGRPYDERVRGHFASLVAISSFLTRGDPRDILVPHMTEQTVLRMMRAFAEVGMLIGRLTPERWRDETSGDLVFYEDMLRAEGVKEGGVVVVLSEARVEMEAPAEIA